MKRKLWFGKEYCQIKRHRLHFFCPVFNAVLTGCNLACNPCLSLKYRNDMRVVNVNEEEFDVYIGRGTKWGNKFVEGVDGTREEVIQLYKDWFLDSPWLHNEAIRKLQGKILGCHCKPLPCHGDILVEFVEGRIRNGQWTNNNSDTEDLDSAICSK